MRKFYRIDPRLQIDKVDDVVRPPHTVRVNDFSEGALKDFEKDLDEAHATGQPIIPVVIDSYGGSVYGLLGMIAAVEGSRLPVATVITSKAMSAGALLFCFGSEGLRFMHPHGTVMIHDIGSFTGGKIEEIKADVSQLDRLNREVYKRASLAIGQKQDYLSKLIKAHNHTDWFLTAKEAKQHNIANHLKVPCFDIEVNLNVRFG